MPTKTFGSKHTIPPNKVTSPPEVNQNATAKIISLNAKGLNVPEKCLQILHSLHKFKSGYCVHTRNTFQDR